MANDKNLLKRLDRLIPYRRDIAWAVGCSEREVPLLNRHGARKTLLEVDAYVGSSMCAGRQGKSVYAIIAEILED
jgi:hypothetical protein